MLFAYTFILFALFKPKTLKYRKKSFTIAFYPFSLFSILPYTLKCNHERFFSLKIDFTLSLYLLPCVFRTFYTVIPHMYANITLFRTCQAFLPSITKIYFCQPFLPSHLRTLSPCFYCSITHIS